MIIRAMPLKTCQLDIILTDKLKEILEGCLPAITHITNSSLDTSSFCEEWKEAIVKPLVKKPSGGLDENELQTSMPLYDLSQML